MALTELERAVEGIRFARGYTLRLLDAFGPGDWFRMPAGGVTHAAWQVGHLAMAEYRLALERTRGRRPDDDALIGPNFLRLFARESVPDPDPDRYPSPAELRATLDRVHARTLEEVPALGEDVLSQPPLKPHAIATTRLECLLWCARHELVHAGQLGLLRRLLGQRPLW